MLPQLPLAYQQRHSQHNPQTFKGYDARPLKGLVMRYSTGEELFLETVQELSTIAKNYRLDVFVQTPTDIVKRDFKQILKGGSFPKEQQYAFPQDHLTLTTDGKTLGNISVNRFNEKIGDFLRRPLEKLKYHLQGGNFFVVKDGASDSLLLGADEVQYYRPESIMKDLNVSKIYPISQPDFHLDLSIRPLKNKKVLIADDTLTLQKIAEGIFNAVEHSSSRPDTHMKKVLENLTNVYQFQKLSIQNNKYKSVDVIEKELLQHGFEPIRVPGRVLRPEAEYNPMHENHFMANYMNAIVHEKPDGSMVFITNKSMLDDILGITPKIEEQIGFSFEKMFKDSIKGFVKEEDMHFVSGAGYIQENLDLGPAGIHCMCSEIPQI